MLKPLLRACLAGALLLGLGACAAQVKSDVARFYDAAQLPKSGTFRVVPADPKLQGSLEFAAYAAQVSDQLRKLGYTPVADGAAADLDVKFGFSVSDGATKVETRPGVRSAFSYYRYSPYYGGFRSWSPWYSPWGSWWDDPWGAPEVYSYTVYTRKIDMTIAQGDKQLFQGRVESVGRDNRLPEVMPYLVQALFTNFPGENGMTKRVVIDIPRKG
jgi:hypothetical protein